MKKHIVFALLSLQSMGVFAQDCKKDIQRDIISKIKKYNPTDLVPYAENGWGWALVDAKSKKRVTDFIFHKPHVFSPEFKNYAFGCHLTISPDYSFHTNGPSMVHSQPVMGPKINYKDELGFDVNQKGEIIAYSKQYRTYSFDGSNISQPILHNGVYYAVLHKKGEDIVIDQKGVEQEHLRFTRIEILDKNQDGVPMFYVTDKENKKGLVSLSGEQKLFGELMRMPRNEGLGYSLQYRQSSYTLKVSASGVIDLADYTWLIKPQNKYQIYQVIVATTEDIDKQKVENRNKAKVYFLAKEGEMHLVLDKNGNPILPKK